MSRRVLSKPGPLLAGLALAAIQFVAAPPALATFPGRDGLIAFYSGTTAGAQIFTVRPDGRDLRQITHVAGDATRPDWSPDGRRIAFELDTADTGQVALMNADGSDLVSVPTPGVLAGDPSFTPDGRRLVFTTFDGQTGGVSSMNLDGSDRRFVETGDDEDPNVSPDGRTISATCVQEPDVLAALCTFPRSGGAVTPLTPFSADVGVKQDWAPDGRRLAYIDHADLPNPGDSANVATVRSDGTDARQLTHFSGGDVNAFTGSYSPDGRWIALRFEDHGRFGLYRIRTDGTHLRAILPLSEFAPRFIDWGPRTADHHGDDNDS